MATNTRKLSDFLAEGTGDTFGDLAIVGEPHIKPGTLYPALRGKILDGTTVHSGAYGTAQADGFSYYYTDIKGSKPIKDPRIGAYFGSQRHKFQSLQLLEQETATHGDKVYSIDGREWCRAVGGNWVTHNGPYGAGLEQSGSGGATDSQYIEIVGYFNDVNVLHYLAWVGSNDMHRVYLNGGTVQSTDLSVSVVTPLGGRYVQAHSLVNLTFNSAPTLGINTLKIANTTGHYLNLGGAELIAQDTTSTATKSKIQIPSQNVVSYGKQFSLSATAHHYNPFATKGDDSASTIPNNTTGDSVATGWAGATSAYWDSTLDTATSLGLGTWESGGNFYRPVNGGRVVKWVDSDGTIKTSVNMMPPEAHSVENFTTNFTANNGTCDATGTHNWSTKFLPTFGNKRIGSNLITGWTTTPAHPFETFTSSGANITQAINTTGYGGAYSNTLSLTAGKLYKASITAALTSGSLPRFGFTRLNNGTDFSPVKALSVGSNTLIFVASEDASAENFFYLEQPNGAPCNIALSAISVYEIEQPEVQAEVAKTFMVREFGNGAANGGTGHAHYADASMLTSTEDDISYVMDDGLTSLSASSVQVNSGESDGGKRISLDFSSNESAFHTFIGTGISIGNNKTHTFAGTDHYEIYVDGVEVEDYATSDVVPINIEVAQNLPYGTHILQIKRVAANSTGFHFGELTIHQPKMPPIPEDSVVIADYMLMADHVQQTDAEYTQISKGVRYCNATRDHFYNNAVYSTPLAINTASQYGMHTTAGTGSNHMTTKLPFFGTLAQACIEGSNQISGSGSTGHHMLMNGSATTEIALDSSVSDRNDQIVLTVASDAAVLGLNTVTTQVRGGAYGFFGSHVATPIHTSSHYQEFETPYLKELVGGDRNMEQTNLVVTADGKTWDEVTRDVSYLGASTDLSLMRDGGNVNNAWWIWDWARGTSDKKSGVMKNFALGYDRIIFLEDGDYEMTVALYGNAGIMQMYCMQNTTSIAAGNGLFINAGDDTGATARTTHAVRRLRANRGDWIVFWVPNIDSNGWHGSGLSSNQLMIRKLN